MNRKIKIKISAVDVTGLKRQLKKAAESFRQFAIAFGKLKKKKGEWKMPRNMNELADEVTAEMEAAETERVESIAKSVIKNKKETIARGEEHIEEEMAELAKKKVELEELLGKTAAEVAEEAPTIDVYVGQRKIAEAIAGSFRVDLK